MTGRFSALESQTSRGTFQGIFSDSLMAATTSAVAHAARLQAADGSWVVAPEPRILENALILHCLKRGSAAPLVGIERVYQWLSSHPPAVARARHPIAFGIEKWLWNAAVNGVVASPEFSQVDPFQSGYARRARLLLALAAESGSLDEEAQTYLRQSLYRAVETSDETRPWSAAEDASLYIVSCPAQDRLDSTQPTIRRSLDIISRARSSNGSIANNPISTALAYLATSLANASSASLCHLGYLDHARIDGTWRFCTTEVWDTALLLRSLLIGGVGKNLIEPARTFLLERQNADGGWPYAPGRASDVDTTSMVLSVLGPHATNARRRGGDHLLARRNSDGLWPTWIDKNDTIADDVTAHAVAALRDIGEHPTAYAAGRRYLSDRLASGTWRADWYDNRHYGVHELGVAVGTDDPTLAQIAEQAISQQCVDGGFAPDESADSSPAATGCALAFLSRFRGPDDVAVVRAFNYLVLQQTEDGSWPGPTGMYGPRPFVSDYAMQTHALALLGITTLLRKVSPRERA